jgi:hypothetical protein
MLRLCKLVVGFVMAAGVMLTPAAVQAETMRFDGVGYASTVYVGGLNGGNYHGYVTAGELNWSWVTAPPAGFAQSFYSYCVDLASFVQGQQVVTATPSSSSLFTNGVTNGGAKAAWLFNEYAAGIHAMTNIATAKINAAALQVAIWEALYDTSANLGGGQFTASANGLVITQAQSYLTSLYSSQPWTSVATILMTSAGQDQVTQVSEPSTLLMMGLAFFGFAALARRPARQS